VLFQKIRGYCFGEARESLYELRPKGKMVLVKIVPVRGTRKPEQSLGQSGSKTKAFVTHA
jgi:hypothetical protein